MPPQLLPASAAAFAPRASAVNVVLGSRVEPWLTQTLKRINRIKRPLNRVHQASKVELPPARGAGYEPLIAILSESLRETSAFGGAVCGVIIAI